MRQRGAVLRLQSAHRLARGRARFLPAACPARSGSVSGRGSAITSWNGRSGARLRAKIATMSLAQFASAARGDSATPRSGRASSSPARWSGTRRDAGAAVLAALAEAARTAARLAAALGPHSGRRADYWRALFQRDLHAPNSGSRRRGARIPSCLPMPTHFDGLLPLAWSAHELAFARKGERLRRASRRANGSAFCAGGRTASGWASRSTSCRLGKATTTFEGAATYGAWKVERHTGVALEVTPFRREAPAARRARRVVGMCAPGAARAATAAAAAHIVAHVDR